MAQTVSTGKLMFTLTANQSQRVTLPFWAKGYGVTVESIASVRVACGDDAGAVEGSTTPTSYETVGVGQKLIEETRGGGIWLFSTGAAVVTVTPYEKI